MEELKNGTGNNIIQHCINLMDIWIFFKSAHFYLIKNQ